MKLFLDSANLIEIESALKRGIIRGITTNPSILANEGQVDIIEHTRSIMHLMWFYKCELPLSVELTTLTSTEQIEQAKILSKQFSGYEKLAIKVPIGWNELEAITSIRMMGINVNATACMSYSQAVMAAAAGARYVSLFWGRIRDGGDNPYRIVRQVVQTFKTLNNQDTEIIVGSIRSVNDIDEAIQAGTDIVTIPYRFLSEMCSHPETDKVVAKFMASAANLKWDNAQQL